MANIVLLTAAGIGSRTHQFIPKQFIHINDKPLIIHTMETFQNHNEIDYIVVVCLKGWESCLKAYAEQFRISKLKSIVLGGNTGYESIKNGINAINSFAKPNDMVLIHDGNRPLTSNNTITECIKTAKEKGNAITVIPVVEVVYDISQQSDILLNRDHLVRVQTPHAASLTLMTDVYDRAEKENLQDRLGFCSLLNEFNIKLNYVYGTEKNFKITTKDDLDIFKGLILLQEQKKHDLV